MPGWQRYRVARQEIEPDREFLVAPPDAPVRSAKDHLPRTLFRNQAIDAASARRPPARFDGFWKPRSYARSCPREKRPDGAVRLELRRRMQPAVVHCRLRRFAPGSALAESNDPQPLENCTPHNRPSETLPIEPAADWKKVDRPTVAGFQSQRGCEPSSQLESMQGWYKNQTREQRQLYSVADRLPIGSVLASTEGDKGCRQDRNAELARDQSVGHRSPASTPGLRDTFPSAKREPTRRTAARSRRSQNCWSSKRRRERRRGSAPPQRNR